VPYIPGSPIDAFCANCKSDTKHVVLEVDGLQVREVRCEKCRTNGEFRAPRAGLRAGLKAAVKRKSMPPSGRKTTRKRAEPPEEMHRRMLMGRDISAAEPYSIKLKPAVNDLVSHPTFGVGIVVAFSDIQKIRVFFEDGERILVCNKG